MLQGLNITISVYHRHQQSDDDVGGSQQTTDPLYSSLPARIGSVRTPMALRIQGIESSDIFDCVCQPADLSSLDIEIDDIVIPETGQYQNQEFVVTASQLSPVGDSPNDFRRHHSLSLRHIVKARRVQ